MDAEREAGVCGEGEAEDIKYLIIDGQHRCYPLRSLLKQSTTPSCAPSSRQCCEQAAFRLLFAGSYARTFVHSNIRISQLDSDQLFARDRHSTDKIFLCV